MQTETLTDDIIRTLRTEAGAAGDSETVTACDAALNGDADAAADVARIISYARAMDESRPFVRVWAEVWDVWSPDSGHALGRFYGETADKALDASARDAGYASYDAIPAEIGGELRATPAEASE
jgi:hypothetical protein